MYRLFIKRSAEKDLRRLPAITFQRINDRILELQDDPRPPGVVKLSGALEGWRIRVGEYRVIYQVDDDTQALIIVRVKHRREVYR